MIVIVISSRRVKREGERRLANGLAQRKEDEENKKRLGKAGCWAHGGCVDIRCKI